MCHTQRESWPQLDRVWWHLGTPSRIQDPNLAVEISEKNSRERGKPGLGHHLARGQAEADQDRYSDLGLFRLCGGLGFFDH